MDNLSLSEISFAVSHKPDGKKLSWIGFDACLMCTAEVAAAVSPHAHYMIASQETEPASGWDYSFLSGIAEDADGAATGKRIIDSYFRSLEGTKDTLTLSCIDLEKTDMLLHELDQFFQPVADRMDPEIGRASCRERV